MTENKIACWAYIGAIALILFGASVGVFDGAYWYGVGVILASALGFSVCALDLIKDWYINAMDE